MASEMTNSALIELIGSLLTLLAEAGEDYWSRKLQLIRDELSDIHANQEMDRRSQDIVREILSLFGGMGSLQDLVLQNPRGVMQEQLKFDHLRDRLFDEARNALR